MNDTDHLPERELDGLIEAHEKLAKSDAENHATGWADLEQKTADALRTLRAERNAAPYREGRMRDYDADEGRYSERLGRHKQEEDLDRSLDLADASRGRRTIRAIHDYIDNVPQDAERDVLDDALNHVIQACRDHMEGR